MTPVRFHSSGRLMSMTSTCSAISLGISALSMETTCARKGAAAASSTAMRKIGLSIACCPPASWPGPDPSRRPYSSPSSRAKRARHSPTGSVEGSSSSIRLVRSAISASSSERSSASE